MKLTDEQKRAKALQAVLRRIGRGKGDGRPLHQQVTAEVKRRQKVYEDGKRPL